MKFLRSRVVILLIATLLPACAFVDEHVQLEYQDLPAVSNSAANQGTIFLSLFEDQRADKSKIGVVKNGYGMETAKVLTDDNPAVWITNTLKGNLERTGYKVSSVKKDSLQLETSFTYLARSPGYILNQK